MAGYAVVDERYNVEMLKVIGFILYKHGCILTNATENGMIRIGGYNHDQILSCHEEINRMFYSVKIGDPY